MGHYMKKTLRWTIIAIATFVVVSVNVYAVSLGGSRVNSYIGQPLNVFVSISSDSDGAIDSNQLVVSRPSPSQLRELRIDSAAIPDELQYKVAYLNQEHGILVTSLKPIKEPYISVVLQITYKGKSSIKQIPVLLDLEPSSPEITGVPLKGGDSINKQALAGTDGSSSAKGSSFADGSSFAEGSSSADGSSSAEGSLSGVVTYSPEIMGAYDWAQAGAIPKKFGPVLDGQSLWRVARRINKAMGVSVDQMMLALYRANPEAFATDSVGSLKAGSILTIPAEDFVREFTEMQAVRQLASTDSSDVSVNEPAQEPEVQDGQLKNEEQISNDAEDDQDPVATQEFAVTGMDSDDANREIIETLHKTVSDLTEQLVVKERRITFLEQQIETISGVKVGDTSADVDENLTDELSESEIAAVNSAEQQSDDINDGQNAPTIADASNDPLTDVSTDVLSTDENELNVNDQGGLVEESSPDDKVETQPAASDTLVAGEAADAPVVVDNTSVPIAEIDSEPVNNRSWTDFFTLPKIVLLLGLLLCALGLYFRKKIASWFAKEDEMVLNVPSVLSSNDKSARKGDIHKPLAKPVKEFIDNDDYFNDDNDDDFFMTDNSSVDVEELNLSDRIKELLNAGNIGEAKKTVRFAEETNMEANYLDFCRLKISAAEKNKSEFATIFNRVNRHINDFHPDIQYRIAEMHRELFDSDNVIDFGFDELDKLDELDK